MDHIYSVETELFAVAVTFYLFLAVPMLILLLVIFYIIEKRKRRISSDDKIKIRLKLIFISIIIIPVEVEGYFGLYFYFPLLLGVPFYNDFKYKLDDDLFGFLFHIVTSFAIILSLLSLIMWKKLNSNSANK